MEHIQIYKSIVNTDMEIDAHSLKAIRQFVNAQLGIELVDKNHTIKNVSHFRKSKRDR
jgi:hypothetical protein